MIRWFSRLVRQALDRARTATSVGAASEIEWYQVSFNETGVQINAQPPGREPWSAGFRWDAVECVCFKAEDMLVSDGIYVFTSDRPESYAIPTEAVGGSELWGEILRRGLFDPELAMEAARSLGGLYCWPPLDEHGHNQVTSRCT